MAARLGAQGHLRRRDGDRARALRCVRHGRRLRLHHGPQGAAAHRAGSQGAAAAESCGVSRETYIGDKPMPLIDVQLIKDVLDAEQKKAVIQKLTDAIVSVAGENLRGAVWVKIIKVNSGELGIAGKPLTTE